MILDVVIYAHALVVCAARNGFDGGKAARATCLKDTKIEETR